MAKKQWEIGAGRITTNFLMVLVDSTYFIKRWKEFFPELQIDGFVYNEKALYVSIWNKDIIEKAIQIIYRDPKTFFSHITKIFEKETEDLWNNLKNLKIEIENLSDDAEALARIHKKYLALFGDYAIYTPIVRFSEECLKRLLKERNIDDLNNIIKPSYKGAQFYLNEELKAIARDINQSEFKEEIKLKILENSLPEDDYLVYHRLLKIKEKYGWVKAYINFYKDVEIQDLLIDLINMIEKKENIDKKEEMPQINLDEETKKIIGWLNFVVDMKNKIQNVQAYIFYLGNKLYSLISKQIKLPIEKIEWLTEDEVTAFLKGFKYEEELIDTLIEDRKSGVLIEPRTGTIVHDNNLIKKIFIHQDIDIDKVFYGEEENKKIQGIFMNKKEIQGKVFIALSHEELMKKEIPSDSILVTRAVTPEYTPYLNKFRAVIADEGGIASHGAIVAREMNVSMIIGARIATKFLQDGEMILLKEDGSIEKV